MNRRSLRLHLVIRSRQKVSENRVLNLYGLSGTHGFFCHSLDYFVNPLLSGIHFLLRVDYILYIRYRTCAVLVHTEYWYCRLSQNKPISPWAARVRVLDGEPVERGVVHGRCLIFILWRSVGKRSCL